MLSPTSLNEVISDSLRLNGLALEVSSATLLVLDDDDRVMDEKDPAVTELSLSELVTDEDDDKLNDFVGEAFDGPK